MKAVAMKKVVLAATLMLFGQVAVTEAQVIYNTGGDEMLQTMMNNTMNTIRTKDMTDTMMAGAMAEKARIEKAGAAKIKSGKATTSFVPTPAGTETLVKTLTFEPHLPQDFAGQVKFVKE